MAKVLTDKARATFRIKLFDLKNKLDATIKIIDGKIYAGIAATPNQRDILARYQTAKLNLNQNLLRLSTAISSGVVDGQLLTEDNLRPVLNSFDGDLRSIEKAVNDWNASNPMGIVLGTIGSSLSATFEVLRSMYGLVSSGAAFVAWLPWIVLGAILIPPAIRIILAARKGGVDSALQETNDSIERGKQSVKDAAVTAARTAATAAKFLI